MKLLSKKIKSLIIAIFATYAIFSSCSYAEEAVNQEHRASLYNPDAEKQSVLFTFLQKQLFLSTAASLLEANEACDYCKLRDEYSTYKNGFPEFLKELGINENDSSNSNKNCNICELLYREITHNTYSTPQNNKNTFLGINIHDKMTNKMRKEVLTKQNINFVLRDGAKSLLIENYKDLYYELFSKQNELQKPEYNLLTEEVGGFEEEVEQLFYGFDMDSLEELKKLNGFYKQMYDHLADDNYPNLLDRISILKAVTDDLLEFTQKIENEEYGKLSLNLVFGRALADYNKFIDNNNDILFEVQTIAENGFKIEDPQCTDGQCQMREIKTLSEIMLQVEKLQKSPKLSNEEINDKLKDLL